MCSYCSYINVFLYGDSVYALHYNYHKTISDLFSCLAILQLRWAGLVLFMLEEVNIKTKTIKMQYLGQKYFLKIIECPSPSEPHLSRVTGRLVTMSRQLIPHNAGVTV